MSINLVVRDLKTNAQHLEWKPPFLVPRIGEWVCIQKIAYEVLRVEYHFDKKAKASVVVYVENP